MSLAVVTGCVSAGWFFLRSRWWAAYERRFRSEWGILTGCQGCRELLPLSTDPVPHCWKALLQNNFAKLMVISNTNLIQYLVSPKQTNAQFLMNGNSKQEFGLVFLLTFCAFYKNLDICDFFGFLTSPTRFLMALERQSKYYTTTTVFTLTSYSFFWFLFRTNKNFQTKYFSIYTISTKKIP